METVKADIRRAAYLTVHEFPRRGNLSHVESAALVIGRAPGTTYNKVDPATDQGLYITEALQLMLASRDYRILHAIAAALDHVAVSLVDMRGISDTELLDLLLSAFKASGDRAETIRAALQDGRIDRAELQRINESFDREMRALCELQSRLVAICVDA